jgi:ribosome maturation protein SDO1
MVSLDDAVVARLARHSITFEILVDPDGVEKIYDQSNPSDDDILKILVVDDVFTHWSDGTRAAEEELLKGFDTLDVATIARRILADGEVQLTQEQRKRMLDQKHKRIIEHIARHAWNPQAKMPHPKDRIERALVEAKWRADPLLRVTTQVDEALKILKLLMPIAVARVNVALRIPAEYTGKAYGQIRQLGKLSKEEWQADGALVAVLDIPAGAQTEVYDQLNAITQGNAETRLLD